MNLFFSIAAGLLRVGKGAKTTPSLYQVERVNPALGGGRTGVVPLQRKQP